MGKRGGKPKGKKGGKAVSKPPSAAEAPAPAPLHQEEPAPLKYVPYEGLPFAPSPSNTLANDVREWIGLPLKITLTDGRIIIGQFYSLDNYRNIILNDCYQAHITASAHQPGGVGSTKAMGMSLVPGDAIVSISVGKAPVQNK